MSALAAPSSPRPLAEIGETFTQRARFSDAEIRAFAASVHDHNPLHHDLAAARAAGYRGLIASGTQLGSVFMAMTATNLARPARDGRPRLGLGMGFRSAFAPPSTPTRRSSCAGPWSRATGRPGSPAGSRSSRARRARPSGLLLSGTGTILLRSPVGSIAAGAGA